MQPLRLAFAGFRHSHILGLYQEALKRSDVQVVAAAEDDPTAAGALLKEVKLTHPSIASMLDSVDCDAVAVGDAYGKRGAIAIDVLRRGRHLLADKPLLTSLADLDQVQALAGSRKLAVGCLLDMHCLGHFVAIRELIAQGELGRIHQIIFYGQHPLLPQSRPSWYFQKGMHGGTINDIAVHALSLIPWLTGQSWDRVIAARTWNAFAVDCPHFMDSAQMMLTLSDGCGVMGDVSYAAAGSQGFAGPQYWRYSIYGQRGLIETSYNQDGLTFWSTADNASRTLAKSSRSVGTCLDWFIADIQGRREQALLETAWVLKVARQALLIQQAAEQAKRDIPLSMA